MACSLASGCTLVATWLGASAPSTVLVISFLAGVSIALFHTRGALLTGTKRLGHLVALAGHAANTLAADLIAQTTLDRTLRECAASLVRESLTRLECAVLEQVRFRFAAQVRACITNNCLSALTSITKPGPRRWQGKCGTSRRVIHHCKMVHQNSPSAYH